jgi:tetratricopeptide (TPR) repeat protein
MKNRLIFIALMTAFLGSWAAADERSSLAAARGRFEKGDFEYSRLLLEDFIQEYPLSLFIEEARLLKALSEYQIGEASSALQSLEMIPLNSLNSESRNSVLYWMGRIHLERGDTESALEDLLAADQQWNTQEQASSYSLLLGRAYIQSENYPQSISFLESYLEEYQPGDSPANSEDNRFQGPEEAVNLLIYALIQEGEWDRVVDLLDQRELSPAQNLYMAEALLGMGDFLRAKSYYESLMNADLSLSVVAYQRLFNAALESGNLAEAQRIITEAELNLAKEPDILMDFWRRIGVGAYRQGDLQNAENYLTKIWFRRQNSIPQEVSVYYLARLYSETLRSKEALDLLKEYAALGGELSSDALSLQAKLYLDSGNFSQAQSIYLGLLTESPQDSSAGLWTYLLAWLSSQQGDSALAISYLQNSSSLTEAHELYAPSLKLLAQEQKKLGNWEVADEAYSRYLSLNPSDPWANSEYLSVYFVQERFALLVGQAQKNKEYLSAWKTAAPRAYFSHQYQYGLALVSLGRYAEAAEILASLETLAAVEEKLLPYGRFLPGFGDFSARRKPLDRGPDDLGSDHPGLSGPYSGGPKPFLVRLDVFAR